MAQQPISHTTPTADTLNDEYIIDAALTSDGISNLNVVESNQTETAQQRGQLTYLNEKKTVPQDTKFGPPKPHPTLLPIKYEIYTPFLRNPLTLKMLDKVSTFLPISINYFQLVHIMDELMSTNTYFLGQGLPWHPFLSRLYFAELFFIQTLRAMRYARIGSSSTKLFIEHFLKKYPPESIPVPGPLVPILQSISASNSENPVYGLICPAISNDIGVNTASDLLYIGDSSFILPNIPLIAGFLNTIIEANDQVPDYTDPETFTDSEDHTINGHLFEADNWNMTDRLALLSPGMNCKVESTNEIDLTMQSRGGELGIPVIAGQADLHGFERYMLMNEDSTWFQNVIDVMSVYCSLFKESSTLGHCSPHGPTCGLVRSRLHHLTSPNAANNTVNQLNHAFPGKYPFTLIYEHRSFEHDIPQNYALMGQLASINTSASYRGLPSWGDFNGPNSGRTGPYWDQNPSVTSTSEENNLKEVENIIASHYFKEKP